MSLAIALSIIAIVLSFPALFLSIYALVCLKARDLAERMVHQERSYSTDRAVVREFDEMGGDSEPNMYGIGEDDHTDYEDI